MAGQSWLLDKSRIATKIKCASGTCDPDKVVWKSNPTRTCPNCEYVIDNSEVEEWPGFPKGVKFDPSDPEIIQHLLAKAGEGNPHPYIDEFIISLEDGICSTHPRHLPGVQQDGRPSHFFHRSVKAYNTGKRKRRKILDQDSGDVRWHKTGKTKPVFLNGVQKGCKKIMVLYTSGAKSEKTNWVMHQYHLGTEEEEKDRDYVISKVLYHKDKDNQDITEAAETVDATVVKVDPVTPKSVTPEPPRSEGQSSDVDLFPFPEMDCFDEIDAACEAFVKDNQSLEETQRDEGIEMDNLSQNMFDSQQMAENIFLLDDFVRSQSPDRGDRNNGKSSSLSAYASLGPEHLKKDIEECQKLFLDEEIVKDQHSLSANADLGPETMKMDIDELEKSLAEYLEKNNDKDQPGLSIDDPLGPEYPSLDPADIERDTPPEHRLSQLEFSSQDSYVAFGYSKA